MLGVDQNILSRAAVHEISLFVQSGLALAFGLCASKKLSARGPFVQSFVLRASIVSVLVLFALSLFAASPTSSLWDSSASTYRMINPPVGFVSPVPNDSSSASISSSSSLSGNTMPRSANRTRTQPSPSSSSSPSVASKPVSFDDPYGAGLDSISRKSSAQAILYEILAAAWIIGSLGCLLRLAAGRIALAAVFRSNEPLRERAALEICEAVCERAKFRKIEIYENRSISGPFLCGIFRPSIVFPVGFCDGLSAEQFEAVVSHEAAHARRSDNAWRLAAQICASLLWFQPLAWLLLRELESVSERACDQHAVDFGCEALEYAGTLLALARYPSPRGLEQSFGAGAIPLKSRLSGRIEELAKLTSIALGPSSPFKRDLALFAAGIVALIFAAFSVNRFELHQESWATKSYLKNFTLPARLGYDMGAATPVASNQSAALNALFSIRYLSQYDIKFIEKVDDCKLNFLDAQTFAIVDAELPDARKLLTYSDPKTRCFAENLIANYYYLKGNHGKESEWRRKCLLDAPIILAGRLKLDNGSPLAGYVVRLSLTYSETLSGAGGVAYFVTAITDQNGCFYIPAVPSYSNFYLSDAYKMSRANNRITLSAVVKGDFEQVSFDDGADMFKCDHKVAILPPVIAHPYVRVTPDYFNASRQLNPVPIARKKLTISWTPARNATSYRIDFGNQATCTYSDLWGRARVADLDHYPQYSYIPADKRTVTFRVNDSGGFFHVNTKE